MSAEPFNKLVKLAARAFYDDITLKGDNQQKTGRSDNRGMAVVILDALTRRQWVREEDLAKDLKLHLKQLRRTLRFFEEEKLVTRDHRKESAKGAKLFTAAIAATSDVQKSGKDGEEKMKMHTHSYCSLDYAQIYDVVRYRMHRMKKKLKDELESRNTIQEYICPNCARRYSALDALQLMSPNDEYFHCEKCDGELVAESDKLAAEEMGDGDDNARRRRREKLKDMLQKMEVQLKPLVDQLARVKDLPAPEFGSLQAWEARAHAAGQGTGDSGANDPSKSSQGQGFGGAPIPYLGETRVEVALSGVEAKEEDKPDPATTSLKVLPPWMIKQGMKLTKEQLGEVGAEDNKSAPSHQNDDKKKKADEIDEERKIQDEFIKAYYIALAKRQRQQEEAVKREQQEAEGYIATSSTMSNGVAKRSSERQIGMKVKREEEGDGMKVKREEEGDIDAEWEVEPAADDTRENSKLDDENALVEAAGGEEDDGIDWEDG